MGAAAAAAAAAAQLALEIGTTAAGRGRIRPAFWLRETKRTGTSYRGGKMFQTAPPPLAGSQVPLLSGPNAFAPFAPLRRFTSSARPPLHSLSASLHSHSPLPLSSSHSTHTSTLAPPPHSHIHTHTSTPPRPERPFLRVFIAATLGRRDIWDAAAPPPSSSARCASTATWGRLTCRRTT
jgi:hypothetical protein